MGLVIEALDGLEDAGSEGAGGAAEEGDHVGGQLGGLFSFAIILVVLAFESLVIIGSDDGMRLGDEIAKTHVVEDKQGGLT